MTYVAGCLEQVYDDCHHAMMDIYVFVQRPDSSQVLLDTTVSTRSK